MSLNINCWCGSNDFDDFCSEYSKCRACGTLVSIQGLSPDKLLVANDDTDFYGKQYWLNHQNQDLGFPDIYTRARNDLIERNLHWLKTLLRYKLPPAKLLELGCSHGSFVALTKQAGYESSGMEMSPWVVAFGRDSFGITVHTGPVEKAELPATTFDVIALMDVLEHLPDPITTMQHCLTLLKPDGMLLIQTPQFKEEMVYEYLIESRGPFLEQLKSDEHLFLFSKKSVSQLFGKLDAPYIQFEPAIFGIYDMFFVVSRMPIQMVSEESVCDKLLSTHQGRLVQALIDLYDQNKALEQEIEVINSDRADRLEQILTLTDMINNKKQVS